MKTSEVKSNLRLFHFATLCFLSLFLQACSELDGKREISAGKGGNLKSIVIPDQADEVCTFAASELQAYLEVITGVRIQIKNSSEIDRGAMAIWLLQQPDTAVLWDGFKIESGRKGVLITASESRGLLFGVYALLEEAGCSFFYPGKNEETVPQKKKIQFLAGAKVFNPLLEHRGIALYGLQESSIDLGKEMVDWMAKNRFNLILISEDRPSDSPGPAHGSIWKEVHSHLLMELQHRGFVIEMSEHCTHVFFPPSLHVDHPEWFALNDGERKLGKLSYNGQMCYANPDGVEYYATELAAYASIHPEFNIIGTWPLDGGNYCECEACKDPQTVFRAAMRVAEKVKDAQPDMIVEYLAYKPQTWQPPDMEEIPANMSVLWCPDHGSMDNLASEWIRKSTNAGGVYKFEYNLGDNYRSRSNVLLRPEFSANQAYKACEMGYRGVISLFLPMENWWRSSFNHYFFARACWDREYDVDTRLSEYYKDYYGELAEEISGIFALIFDQICPESMPDSAIFISGTKDILNQLDLLIAECENPGLNLKIFRLRTYVEFNQLFGEAYKNRSAEGLEFLAQYSAKHPDQDMVLMYPDYIRWRNESYFTE